MNLALWGVDMVELNHTNLCGSKAPRVGDILVIQTKKSKDEKILASVKDVVNGNEVILQKSTNSFYNHDMYYAGESWVCRVWNLGNISLTASTNSMKQFADK
jgi:hypothetical protein